MLRDTGTRCDCGCGCGGCGWGWGCGGCGWGGCWGCGGCCQAVTLPSDSPPGELKAGKDDSSALVSW